MFHPYYAFTNSNFPAQFDGLKAYCGGAVVDLCMVDPVDAPSGTGGVMMIEKGGAAYAVYLVETSDPDASYMRVNTTTGVKAIRLKT